MLVESGDKQVTCICAVDSQLATFQIDSGSTFSQISPSLAPARVPRFGLGVASCLGRRRWFPTCEVQLAPLDTDGNVMWMGDDTELVQPVRVQIGPLNLLGLRELQEWRVQLTFGPEARCSVSPTRVNSLKGIQDGFLHDTVALEDALRAANALTEGELDVDDARSDIQPWLVDVVKCMSSLRARTMFRQHWWPTPSQMSPPSMGLASARMPATPQLTAGATKQVGQSCSNGVLFGTADALLSHSMLPPLLS